MADRVSHYLVESSGQEAQVVHGVFPTEAEAVAFAERLMADFYESKDDSRLWWGFPSHLEVEKWCGDLCWECRRWRNWDTVGDGGVWVTEEEYDRLTEEGDDS